MLREPWGKGGRDQAGSGSQARWGCAGAEGPSVKGPMSAGAKDDEVCPFQGSSPLASRFGLGLPPELPAVPLGSQPGVRMPGPRQGWWGAAGLLWLQCPWRGGWLWGGARGLPDLGSVSGSDRAGLCPRSPSRGGRTASASPSAATLRSESRPWIPVSVLAMPTPLAPPCMWVGSADETWELWGSPTVQQSVFWFFRMKRIIFLSDHRYN